MSRVLLVLNAGSSSIKFSVFALGGAASLTRASRGEVDGIGERPRFVATDGAGARLVDEHPGASGGRYGHDDALAAILAWI
ncbi:MAG: acetate kinase, partial [candidate division NC10 bacterium]